MRKDWFDFSRMYIFTIVCFQLLLQNMGLRGEEWPRNPSGSFEIPMKARPESFHLEMMHTAIEFCTGFGNKYTLEPCAEPFSAQRSQNMVF